MTIEKYLAEVEKDTYAQLDTRNRLGSWLVFGACQLGSATLSVWLLQTTANLTVALTGSAFLALLPGVLDMSGDLTLAGKESRLEVPMQPVIKVIGGLSGFVVSNYRHWIAQKTTEEGIKLTYQQLQPVSPWLESLPTVLTVGVAGSLAVTALAISRRGKNG